MIPYRKSFGGFGLLLRVYGAPWPRALVLALPSTALAVLASLFLKSFVSQLFLHPASYLIYGSVVTFCLVFRANMSYNRYWEACTSIRSMSGKWADAVIQVIAFDEAAEEDGVPGGLRFRSEFVHIMSLMHALALQSLRGDSSLSNMEPGEFLHSPAPPPADAANLDEWGKYRQLRGILFLRSKKNHFESYWRCSPLKVIGGLNPSEIEIMEPSTDRVFLAMCWIMRLIGKRRHEGGIKVEAPIISRVYQVLSDGMQGFENASKVAHTPFPFPFAQSVSLLLHLNSLVVPLTLARWSGETWLVGLLTFLAVFASYLLNEVAREIEDPFTFEPNDLPLMLYQHQFNEHLVTAFVKSIFPEETSVFLDHILQEDSMRAKLDLNRPTLSRSMAHRVHVDLEISDSQKSKSGRVFPDGTV